MPRLLFTKKGNSIWISHLDLMRLFQRAFKRAGLPLKHTQGYNPRPSVSIALPLSVGVESSCELLDFELDGVSLSNSEIKNRLNQTLVDGIEVLDVYDNGRKYRDLAFLSCEVSLCYDQSIPDDAQSRVEALFSLPAIVLPKKTKNGIQDQDIIPMIRSITVSGSEKEIRLHALICCQNPTLNPAQLILAINNYLPELVPVFSCCTRLEIFDQDEIVFR